MHIFIDEAGTFSTPVRTPWSISCIGALVVMDRDIHSLLMAFQDLKGTWGAGQDEVKGSKLDEVQVAATLNLLSQFDVMYEAVAIDMALQTNHELTTRRHRQADVFISCIDERFNDSLVKSLIKTRSKIYESSNQLFLQGICATYLLSSVLKKASLYYVQRCPEELGGFHWRFDSKGDEITPFEALWTSISLPILESMSIQDPLSQVEGMDYSHFRRFERELPKPPDRLQGVVVGPTPFQFVDIKAIFGEDRTFERSDRNLGVQLADIVTTTLRRAMNGHLGPDGWAQIGQLMVQTIEGQQVIQLLDLSGHAKPFYREGAPPYHRVIRLVQKTRKPMRLPGD